MTKDDRKIKLRFDSSYQFDKAVEAITKRATVTNDRDFFSYDFSQPMATQEGISPSVIQQMVTKEYDRMKVF